MATNNLRPEQDLLFRRFFKVVLADAAILRDSPAHRRQILAICLEALNYNQLPNGAFIARDTKVVIPFGSADYSAFPNEWDADEERANATINNSGQSETSASGSPQSAEVRETILSEDV